jgi:hypothetical protein
MKGILKTGPYPHPLTQSAPDYRGAFCVYRNANSEKPM